MTNTNKKTARGRPRKLDPDIGLNTALKLFQQQGFENVSVAQLCNELDIPPTSLYATFGNKEQLFLQVLQRYCDGYFDVLEQSLRDSENPAQVFRNTLEKSLDFYLNTNQKTGCLLLLGNTFCKQPNIIQEISASQHSLQNKLNQRLNELGSENGNELTDVLITLLCGFAQNVRSDINEEQLYTSLEFFCAAFDC
ncbi:TetR/AcrR family transcriptional regulator [Aliiglaciecola sp. LCG003]|uniref:TetR/AcrR family transcriptional regulator n=1 Tax=Aliiglaciecola sp. LCG003 TaxID=3053655 RepID=UPI0025742A81|nr:TetR/AcrR family transcriptional regulator [Aliiglaciecola sp. LCG003]WJG09573.1 TetR/AcrR family transcriptional regulator [Aliiglaciecola sp. LCG003]